MEQNSEPTNDEAIAKQDSANIEKIKSLLKSKNDTQMFAGLALLRSVLDNSPRLQQNPDVVYDLWTSVDGKFISRLIKTGSKPSSTDYKNMLDLGISVLHTFALLLPQNALEEARFINRIQVLVPAALHSSDQTTELLLQLLYTLASTEKGAQAIVKLNDLSPLTEIATTNPKALDVLRFAFINAMGGTTDKPALRTRVNETIQSLISSFRGTDAVTLLEFLGSLLRQADPSIIPSDPLWLESATSYIRNLVTSRPSQQARAAYTNAAGALLQAYPDDVAKRLFSDEKTSEKPFGYLLLNLLLIDIRSSAPVLLEQLSNPNYQSRSRRLASAFDIICIFIGFLVRSLEDETMETLIMPPDSLFKLRKGISETLSVTMEFLRDRWDASNAGAMGLHPDARESKAETSMGSRHTLAWDSITNPTEEDPFTISAIRTLALWLREEENDQLREEATGLTDMFMDLYRSSKPGAVDYRSPVLVALEGLITIDQGREILLKHGGWKILSQDLTDILEMPPQLLQSEDASRGINCACILLDIVEQEPTGTAEEWMNLITTVAAWNPPDPEVQQSTQIQEFRVAVLQLCCVVLANAAPGMRTRYRHSASAISGIANQLSSTIETSNSLKDPMTEVLDTLASISIA